MKSTLTWFLAAATITLAVVCVMQSRKLGGQKTQLAAFQGELEGQAEQLETVQAAQKRAEQQRSQWRSQAEELAAQLQARQLPETNVVVAASTNPPPASEGEKTDEGKSGFGQMLSKMMQDPDTRKFIREQQRMMMDQMYAPLVKRLGLTPEEAAQFKGMMADNAVSAAEKATSMFGSSGSTNRAETLTSLTADQKSFDEQVKAFLGEDRYAQYKDYQETMGERAMLNQFKQQAGSDYNLTDPQAEALLTFMKEEKKNAAAATDLPLGKPGQDAATLQALMSDDKTEQMLKAQESVNQRVYERARTILSPDQLNTFGQFQTNQMQMMRMGMGMVKTMFGPDKPATAAPPTNP